MRLEDVLVAVGEPDCLDAVAVGWEQSVVSMPPQLPAFLDPVQFRASREFARLPEETDTVLQETATKVAQDPALLDLIWHAYRTLTGPEDGGDFRKWPVLESSLGDLAGAFYMLVGLAIVPHIRELHREMNVPPKVTRDTCHVLVCLSWNYERTHPRRLGIMLKELSWVRNHLNGKLFRIGRLEFMIGPFRGCLEAYRHRTNGHTIALAIDGTRLTSEGYIPYRGASPDGGEWVATLRKADDHVVGFPISPKGVVRQQEVSLSLHDWQPELWPGQPSLEFHIPEGGGMTPERCLDSMHQGLAFFAEFFPDTPVAGYYSHSWIFGPMLEEYLPDSANLIKLLREVYLFPVPATPREGLYYIFGSDDVDIATAPRDSSLRRATLDFLSAGGSWRCGGMFFLKSDLGRLGTQLYRSQWAAALDVAS